MNFQSTAARTSNGCLFLLLLLLSCLISHSSVLAAPQSLTPQSAQHGRPNIIVVFIDDMGWSDLSCFAGKQVETEHIDRLAAEGIRFTNFYVNSPICSPSRVALSLRANTHNVGALPLTSTIADQITTVAWHNG